jgi:superfamily I DNA and RNA helicase
MEFIWTDSDQTTYTERSIWKALKSALATDEGLCYYRYPTLSADLSRREPDFLILHRKWGLYTIECKSFNIDNIDHIDGPLWIMRNWQASLETPHTQAEDHMISILNKFRSESELRRGKNSVIEGHSFIALPAITREEWRERHFDESPTSPKPNTIIFADDLEPEALHASLQQILLEEKQSEITDRQWLLAISILRGSPVLRSEPRPETHQQSTKAALLRQVEQQMRIIDQEQHKVAVQIPDGPQRIRGLAGSGKTVVMCMKVAEMHLRHPEWDIVYTFYTRSLYAQIKSLVSRFYRYWNNDPKQPEPNWNKLRILHGWGGTGATGLYSMVARKMQREPRTYQEAQNAFRYKEQSELLGQCCGELLESGKSIPTLFDAIVMDEAQDFHFDFYKLCYSVLKDPKRLIWAYDEVQSLESLSIPTTIDIFGTLPDGSPVVDLEGTYPDGEIEKDFILYRCYRNPRPVIVTAHIFGMGLLRQQGAVQFIPTQGGWEDIGYEVVSGTFAPGQIVTLRRPEANSPHLLEKLAGYPELVKWHIFEERDQELDWIAQQIKNNIEVDELKPEEIAVISLDWKKMNNNFQSLQQKLEQLQVRTLITGTHIDKGIFQVPGKVTLAGIFKAKGNEASVVYVMGFEQVESNRKFIVQDRNQAFTAMTRTRGWCILTGIGVKATRLFSEMETILSQGPEKITFTVPDPTTIQRNLDNLEYERRRNRIKKARDLAIQLERVLAELNDDSVRKEVLEKLRGNESKDK